MRLVLCDPLLVLIIHYGIATKTHKRRKIRCSSTGYPYPSSAQPAARAADSPAQWVGGLPSGKRLVAGCCGRAGHPSSVAGRGPLAGIDSHKQTQTT